MKVNSSILKKDEGSDIVRFHPLFYLFISHLQSHVPN
jgi:hypothetical protein